MTRNNNNTNIIYAILLVQWAAISSNTIQSADAFDLSDEPSELLRCQRSSDGKREQLSPKCHMLELYNQTEADTLGKDESEKIGIECACELADMNDKWIDSFDTDPITRHVWQIVHNCLEATHANRSSANATHPDFLWSDIDVMMYHVSIFTATRDYFEQEKSNTLLNLSDSTKRLLTKDPLWRAIRIVCRKVATDKHKLYRYLENLRRLSPELFFQLVTSSQVIEMTYQASKSCKLLARPHLNAYRLRPTNSELVPVEPSNLGLALNSIDNSSLPQAAYPFGDLNTALRSASTLLLNCSHWQKRMSTIQELARTCPVMLDEPSERQWPGEDWIKRHPNFVSRTRAALYCACQLLLHNATWPRIIDDANVRTMSAALTNYMNRRGLPDFTHSPVWVIHGWFTDIMSKFVSNRKNSVKEIVKTLYKDQDPLVPINKVTKDGERALELLRRGCNYIMFNYNKGSRAASEIKLIKYLDNLQKISLDPMFIFHLTLQDANLFKLYALSKMCEPVVR